MTRRRFRGLILDFAGCSCRTWSKSSNCSRHVSTCGQARSSRAGCLAKARSSMSRRELQSKHQYCAFSACVSVTVAVLPDRVVDWSRHRRRACAQGLGSEGGPPRSSSSRHPMRARTIAGRSLGSARNAITMKAKPKQSPTTRRTRPDTDPSGGRSVAACQRSSLTLNHVWRSRFKGLGLQ